MCVRAAVNPARETVNIFKTAQDGAHLKKLIFSRNNPGWTVLKYLCYAGICAAFGFWNYFLQYYGFFVNIFWINRLISIYLDS